jgi:ribosomal protein L6P/L9E
VALKANWTARYVRRLPWSRSDDQILVKAKDDSQRTRAFTGLTRTLINNMVIGVEKGFQKKLLVEGVGYRVEAKGDTPEPKCRLFQCGGFVLCPPASAPGLKRTP